MSRPRIVAPNASPPTVALVAGDGQIAELLGDEGVAVEAFETVDSLLTRDREAVFCALVLRIDGAVASLAQTIEPVTRRSSEPLVLVCEQIDRWEVRAALAAGAAGVVDAAHLHAALGPCLRAVRAGQVCVPRAQSRQIEPPALSAREKQVLGLVVMGYMNSQIAEQLFLAESTVKSHLSSAFGKLGVRSRNEAVSLILDPERGLGMGILALGGERLDSSMATAQ
jgi:DNA-binding NarL/FixJ family response regulator